MAIPPAAVDLIDELTSLYRSLPARPTIEEIEAAISVLDSANTEEESKLRELEGMERHPEVPDELFFVLKEAKKNWVSLQAQEQRKEALYILDLDKIFQVFDDLIQRASNLVKSGGEGGDVDKVGLVSFEKIGEMRKEEKKEKGDRSKELVVGSGDKVDTIKSEVSEGGGEEQKLSLIQVASVIESSAKNETKVLNLQGKLTDQIEWLPVSLGKLQEITELNLSENRIMALPPSMSNLKSLIKLDIHSNQLINLPESFGELVNLMELDLHANRLKSLPKSFGKLVSLINLDLSSNQFSVLPESIGNLTNLRKLNAETNELEELPYTIGSCISLTELRLDFNQLKGLPEALGKLENLEILTLHYNRVKGLPTTMSSLSKLRELDVSFNELETIPEGLCLVTSLVRLDVSRNFADLRGLPRSIGNLEMLEELDISSDQIRVLPDSFRFLSRLCVFNADETPLEVPPQEVVKLGAKAVVKYMEDLVAERESRSEKKVGKGFWSWLSSLCWPRKENQKKSFGSDYV